MDAEIAKAPAEMRPMLEVVQAQWYWQYFLHNRWRFMQRTATAAAPGKDFTTWDLAAALRRDRQAFSSSTGRGRPAQKNPHRATTTTCWKRQPAGRLPPHALRFRGASGAGFLQCGRTGRRQGRGRLRAWRPTARSSSRSNSSLPGSPNRPTTDSPTLKAVRLYQQLLRFHQNDADKTAFLDVDLQRLILGHNKAVGEEKADALQSGPAAVHQGHFNHPLSALARYHLATSCSEENELVDAHDIAAEGMRAFPRSPGGILCYNLVKQIEAKSASIMTERVWNEPSPVDPRQLSQRDEGLLPPCPRGLAARMKSGRYRGEWLDDAAAADVSGQEPGPRLVGRPAADGRLPRADRGRARAQGPQARLLLPARQPR